jgi:hypothetical protein
LGQIGKNIWNSTAETVAGYLRAPQILHDAAGAVVEGIGIERDQEEIDSSARLNDRFKSLGDFAANAVGKIQFDLDESGKYDKGLVSRNEQGDWEYNGIEGAAHSIGQSLGFVVSMLGPGLTMKGARALGVGTTALRAAKAAGDVDKVAKLTQRAAATEKAMRYVGGVASQVEPLYQDALEATGDSHTAARFTAVVAPVVAAIDAFTGIEASLGGGAKRQFTKEAVKEALRGMGPELTEEAFIPVAKTFAQKYLLPTLTARAKEGAAQFAIEGGTEVGQEAYQMMVEKLFDRQAGNTKLSDHGGDEDVRLINAGALGGILGGSMGATFYRGGMYQPTAFKMLQDSYLEGGNVGLQAAMDDLHQGRIDWRSEMPEHNDSDLHGQIEKMGSVIKSFQNLYQVDGKTQYQYFDLSYNQLPLHQQIAGDLQEQYEALTSENPMRLLTDEDGAVIRNDDGSPVAYPVDPTVAQTMAANLQPELTDQQRRVTYMTNVSQQLTQTGKYQQWAKGFDQIGKFQPGDRVSGADLDTRDDVTGTVADISEDGQVLTIETPGINPESGPVRKTVRAVEAREESNANRPEPVQPTAAEEIIDEPVTVGNDLADGFTQHGDLAEAGYQVGDNVVLASNINDTATITAIEPNDDNDPQLTIEVPNGTARPDVVSARLSELSDKQSPNRLLGRYSPEQAVNAETYRKRQSETAKARTDLRSKVSPVVAAAIDRMNETKLTARYEAIKGDKTATSERNYIEFIAQQNGWPVTAPEAPVLSQMGYTVDNLAADTPAPPVSPLPENASPLEEVITDEQWNQIIDSEQIPSEVMQDIAARSLLDLPLTERQQLLFENFDEADADEFMARMDILFDEIVAGEENQKNQSNETDTPNTDPTDSSRGGNVDETANLQTTPTPEGTSVGISNALPGNNGSPSPQLANEPGAERPIEDRSPDGTEEAGGTGVEQTSREEPAAAVSPAVATLAAEADKQVAAAKNRNRSRKNIAPPQPDTTTEVDEVTDVTAADPTAPEPIPDESIAPGSGPISLAPPVTTVMAEIGMPVRVGSSQRDGIVTAFVGQKIEVEYKNNAGRKERFAFEPNLVRDNRGVRSVTIPENADTQATPAATQTTDRPALRKVSVGDLVGVPGFSDTLVGEVLTIDPQTGDVAVRVLVTGATKTVSANQVSRASAKEIELAQKRARENQSSRIMRQRAEAITAVDPIGRAAIDDWVRALKKAFPRSRVEILSNDAMTDQFGENVRGAVAGGVVYINEDLAGRDTPLHEFSHLYAEVIKKNQPQLFQRGMSLVKGTSYEARVREMYPELTKEESVLEEAMVQAIGEKGASMATAPKVESFLNWFKAVARRIAESLKIPLSVDTTLDEFAMNRAAEILSGRVVSMESSEELARPGVARQRATTNVPAVADEAWLRANAPGSAIEEMDINVDPSTGELLLAKVKQSDEQRSIVTNKAHLERQGNDVKFITGMAQYLDPKNLMRQVFGNSEYGQRFSDLMEQRLGVVSTMKVKGHDFVHLVYDQLKDRTLFRGGRSVDSVEKWAVTGAVEGQTATVQLPVDVVMKIAAMYRSTISSHGYFDHRHTEKVKAGDPLTATFKVPNLTDPDQPLLIELDKNELRRIEELAFLGDDTSATLMQAWSDHASSMFPEIDRTNVFIKGSPLTQANFYFPISTAQTEKQLAQRTISQFVDDVRGLKERRGPAKVFDATGGFVQAVVRYQTDMENFVQLAPIWHNLDRLLYRQGDSMQALGLGGLTKVITQMRDGFAQPYANRNGQLIETGELVVGGRKPLDWLIPDGVIDVGKVMRLATLSRFAFNIAIPLKQITGYFSAYGSGAIDSRFLGEVAPFYGKLIAESYLLVGRGGASGHYDWMQTMRGQDTAFDRDIAEMRSIGTPEGDNLVWRAMGSTHPDVQFSEWGGMQDAATRRQLVAKMRSWFEEYGLSISQRADSAIVLALYRAAKLHVAANSPQLSEAEQRQEAAIRAKQAMYYSNQTFDKSDRAAIQLNASVGTQLLMLYKSQQVKIFNTMAGRTMDVAYAQDKDKRAARLRLAGNLSLNVLLSTLLTTGIDIGIQELRSLSAPKPADDKKDDERSLIDYMMQWISTMASSVPGAVGEIGSYTLYQLANPDSKRDVLNANPVKTVGDFVQATGMLASDLTTKGFSSTRDFQEKTVDALRATIRTGAVVGGVPTELVRQLNNGIDHLLSPPPKEKVPSRSRSRVAPREREENYGIEYVTGTEEETERPTRRR